MTHIIHTASPLPNRYTGNADRDLFDPAIKGTTTILQDGLTSPTLKKVVITSSVTALRNETEAVWTEKTWNPLTREGALELEKKIKSDPSIPSQIYGSSKTLAEKAAWTWYNEAEEKKKPPHFTLTTVLPNYVVGAPALREREGVISSPTASFFWIALTSKGKPNALTNASGRLGYVDVGDLAKIHVDALLDKSTDGRRLFAVSDQLDNFEASQMAHKVRPQLFEPLDGVDSQAEERKKWFRYEESAFVKERTRPMEQVAADFIDYVTANKLKSSIQV